MTVIKQKRKLSVLMMKLSTADLSASDFTLPKNQSLSEKQSKSIKIGIDDTIQVAVVFEFTWNSRNEKRKC